MKTQPYRNPQQNPFCHSNCPHALEILHEELQFSASRLQKKTSHAPVRPEHVQTTPVAEKQRQTIPPGNLLHVLLTDLENRDCPSINRFEVLLKEDEEGESDHMGGF